MKVQDALSAAIERISNFSEDHPRHQAEWMIQSILNVSRADIYTDETLTLNPVQARILEEYIQRRIHGEPLQYILGTVEFRNLTLKIDPRALIPRPETEGLVEIALGCLKGVPNARVLDMGTGCGNIALSILDENPKAHMTAVDIDTASLALAKENCTALGFDDRIEWIECDFFSSEFCLRFDEPFDLILSNPPYISQKEYWELPGEIRRFEPVQALLAANDGLRAIIRLAEICGDLLKTGHHIVCEIGENQAGAVLRIFQNTGWDAYIKKDLSGKPRYLVASKHRTPTGAIWWQKSFKP